MTPEERRAAIVTATVPLLIEHGGAVTTGLIAAAAGIAEGTVFRAFADKQELLFACLDAAFDPAEPIARLRAIPAGLPIEQRLLRASAVVSAHWERAVHVAHAVRSTCQVPPGPHRPGEQRHPGRKIGELAGAIAELLEPEAHRLRLSPQRCAQIFLITVTSDRMVRVRMNALGDPGDNHVADLIEVFLHGALKGDSE